MDNENVIYIQILFCYKEKQNYKIYISINVEIILVKIMETER